MGTHTYKHMQINKNMCIFKRYQLMQYVYSLNCELTLQQHKEHQPSMHATTFHSKCCIVWKMSSITFKIKENPHTYMYWIILEIIGFLQECSMLYFYVSRIKHCAYVCICIVILIFLFMYLFIYIFIYLVCLFINLCIFVGAFYVH